MNFQEVSETRANETIQAIYDEVKSTLCLSYVPTFFRVLASNEAFLQQMWASLEPTLTTYFVRSADDVRASAVDLSQSLGGGDELGLPAAERETLESALWVVHFGAPKVLLVAVSLEDALSTRTSGSASRVVWPQNKGVPRGMPRSAFVHPDDADESIQSLYGEIEKTLQLPTVTDEWRALGSSESALKSAWTGVRGLVEAEGYPEAVAELTSSARERGRTLPRPMLDLDPDSLRDRGVDGDAQSEIRETVEAFVPALARETIHTALWLSRLASPAEAKRSGQALIRRWTVPNGYRTETVLA